MSDETRVKIPKPKKPAKMGRPTKLTPQVQEEICKALRYGSYLETAAAYANVDKATLYAWMKKGNKQKKGPFRDFLNAVDKAFADSELSDLSNIDKAAANSWQAAAWRLERKFPKKWGRKQLIRHEDEDSKEDNFQEESMNAYIAKSLDDVEDDQFED